MVDANYPGNSRTEKQVAAAQATPPEKPKVEPVAQGKTRKRPLGKRMADTFAGDDARSVGGYVLFEVVLPAVKNIISDAVSQGVERMLFGDVKGRVKPSQGRPNGYTSYNKMSTGGGRVTPGENRRDLSSRARTVHDFDEIILETRSDAEQVLDKMQSLIDSYGVVTVADLYAMVDVTGEFTDNKWGWETVAGASVIRSRNGYLLNLPATVAL